MFQEIANKACDFLTPLNYGLKYFPIGKNCYPSFEGDLMDHSIKAYALNARTNKLSDILSRCKAAMVPRFLRVGSLKLDRQ